MQIFANMLFQFFINYALIRFVAKTQPQTEVEINISLVRLIVHFNSEVIISI